MNEVIKSMLERRSVREFSPKKISKDDLALIVLAAGSAPSGKNRRSWKFTVVQNDEMKKKLASAVAGKLGLGEGYNFYNPDTLILVSNKRDNPLGTEDCACAMENIFLAASSLGIGSVWINQLKGICDVQSVRRVLHEMKLESDQVVFGCAALGYPAPGLPSGIRDRSASSEWIL